MCSGSWFQFLIPLIEEMMAKGIFKVFIYFIYLLFIFTPKFHLENFQTYKKKVYKE